MSSIYWQWRCGLSSSANDAGAPYSMEPQITQPSGLQTNRASRLIGHHRHRLDVPSPPSHTLLSEGCAPRWGSSCCATKRELLMMGDRGRITVKHVSLELSIEAMQKQCTLGGVRVGVDSNGKLWNRDSRLEARQKDF
ncbi:hypothetical protein BN1723_000951 [Verticillium longisporum]|uniref:Uncharacterized protein n=1 Tax=Verticillium longisporum TaxID=100787 RepID=A0A0G4NDC3_VERLO|nr:hypothetical protein BN1723_000951 [Verticillium longisporum]